MKSKVSHNHDTHLIRKVKEGDIDAFKTLVEQYKDLSLSLVCSILKDNVKAEDVLQDVFIKVYEKINTFNFKSTFATWLYRIVVNTSYNALKKEQKYQSDDLDKVEVYNKSNSSIEFYGLNDSDQKKYIQLALEQMKPTEALLLRLFYLCELKIPEIREITGFKISKIKVGLHRGRQNMYHELSKLLGSELKDLL